MGSGSSKTSNKRRLSVIDSEASDYETVHAFSTFVSKLVASYHVEFAPLLTEPVVEYMEAAVLFVDISGFSKLSSKLEAHPSGSEQVTQVLNVFFSRIITVLTEHGGDVVKFAGDALLTIFSTTSCRRDALELPLVAVHCARQIQRDCGTCDVNSVSMTLHCGVTFGDIASVHIGGVNGRWEHLVLGTPLQDMGAVLESSNSGEIVVSVDVQLLTNQVYDYLLVGGDEEGVFKLIGVQDGAAELSEVSVPTIPLGPHMTAALSSYAPEMVKQWVHDGQHGLLGSFRPVTVLFVGLNDIDVLDSIADEHILQLQNIFATMQQSIDRFNGFLRQFLLDDKGVVLIAVWGVPPHSHEDDPLRCVRAALDIHSQLDDIGIQCSAGITSGRALVGIVGDENRREFAVVGAVVNLAARLMSKADGSIFCDGNTVKSCGAGVRFKQGEAVELKGSLKPVQLYQVVEAAGCARTHSKLTLQPRHASNAQLIRTATGDVDSDDTAGTTSTAARKGFKLGLPRQNSMMSLSAESANAVPPFSRQGSALSLIRQNSDAHAALPRPKSSSNLLSDRGISRTVSPMLSPTAAAAVAPVFGRRQSSRNLMTTPDPADTSDVDPVGSPGPFTRRSSTQSSVRNCQSTTPDISPRDFESDDGTGVGRPLSKSGSSIQRSKARPLSLKEHPRAAAPQMSARVGPRGSLRRQASGRRVSMSATIVGRESEQDTIVNTITCLAQPKVLASPHFSCRTCSLLLLEGDVGMGKSMLLEYGLSFVQLLRSERLYIEVFWYSPSAIETSEPYLSFRQALEAKLHLGPHNTTLEMQRVLKGALRNHHSFSKWEAHLGLWNMVLPSAKFDTVSPDCEDAVGMLHAMMVHVLCKGSVPLLIALDDAQHMDNHSWSLLHYIASTDFLLTGLLVICSFRPLSFKKTKDVSYSALLHLPYAQHVLLQPMSAQACFDIVCEKFRVSALPQPVKHLLNNKAIGNPLISLELCNMLLSRKLMAVDARGRCNVWATSAELQSIEQLPATIQGMIIPMIDQLSPTSQDVLKTASVLGQEFYSPFVLDLVRCKRDVFDGILDHLVDLGLLQSLTKPRGLTGLRKGSMAPRERRLSIFSSMPAAFKPDYTFKTSIVRDTVYSLLLYGQRQKIHRQLAQLIDDRSTGPSPRLAYHYYHACLPLNDDTTAKVRRRAMEVCYQAGREAMKKQGFKQAIVLYKQALDVFDSSPKEKRAGGFEFLEMDILVQFAYPEIMIYGFNAETQSHLTRAWNFVNAHKTLEKTWLLSLRTHWLLYLQCEISPVEAGNLALKYLQSTSLTLVEKMIFHSFRSAGLAYQGDLVGCQDLALLVCSLGQPSEFADAPVFTSVHALSLALMEGLAVPSLSLGDLRQFDLHVEHAKSYLCSVNHQFQLVMTIAQHSLQLLFYRWYRTAERIAHQALQLAEAHEFLIPRKMAKFVLGAVLCYLCTELPQEDHTYSFRHREKEDQEAAHDNGHLAAPVCGFAVHEAGNNWRGFNVEGARKGFAMMKASKCGSVLPLSFSLIAECALDLGEVDEAESVLDDWEVWIKKSAVHLWSCELHRLRGRLVKMRTLDYRSAADGLSWSLSDLALVDEHYCRSVNIANTQACALLQVRSLLDRACLSFEYALPDNPSVEPMWMLSNTLGRTSSRDLYVASEFPPQALSSPFWRRMNLGFNASVIAPHTPMGYATVPSTPTAQYRGLLGVNLGDPDHESSHPGHNPPNHRRSPSHSPSHSPRRGMNIVYSINSITPDAANTENISTNETSTDRVAPIPSSFSLLRVSAPFVEPAAAPHVYSPMQTLIAPPPPTKSPRSKSDTDTSPDPPVLQLAYSSPKRHVSPRNKGATTVSEDADSVPTGATEETEIARTEETEITRMEADFAGTEVADIAGAGVTFDDVPGPRSNENHSNNSHGLDSSGNNNSISDGSNKSRNIHSSSVEDVSPSPPLGTPTKTRSTSDIKSPPALLSEPSLDS